MKPTSNQVFVEREETKTLKFEYKGADVDFRVVAVGNSVDECKVGDFILFTDDRAFRYKGEDYIVVDKDDIVGVAHA